MHVMKRIFVEYVQRSKLSSNLGNITCVKFCLLLALP